MIRLHALLLSISGLFCLVGALPPIIVGLNELLSFTPSTVISAKVGETVEFLFVTGVRPSVEDNGLILRGCSGYGCRADKILAS